MTAPAETSRPHLGSVVLAESTKLRSLASTTWSLLAAAGISIGTAMLAARSPNVEPHTTVGAADAVGVALAGFAFGQVAICVLGALTITGEYARDGVRTSLSAVPRRGRLLAGKALALLGTALVAGTVISALSFVAAYAMMGTRDVQVVGLGAGSARAIVGGGLYLAVLSLFCLGIGVIVRHSAGAIAAAISIVLILPNVLPVFGSFGQTLFEWWPSQVGQQIMLVVVRPGQFTPWAGFGYFCACTAVLLGIAHVVLRRRDA